MQFYFVSRIFVTVLIFDPFNSRNPDIHEAVLEDDQGKPALKFSIATGFRNIQTLVRKMKTKTSLPHYVEIMACPTGILLSTNNSLTSWICHKIQWICIGCLNGGAQVRPANTEPSQSRELAFKLENDYHQLPEVKDTTSAQTLLDDLSNDASLYSRVLYTDFHAVEKMNLGMKW